MLARMTDGPQDDLGWLTRWYASQCDGDWEHAYGVEIGTLDNPGWTLTIDLVGTALESAAFETVSCNTEATSGGDPSQRWHHCRVEDGRFQGSGGVADLPTIIGVFRAWAEKAGGD